MNTEGLHNNVVCTMQLPSALPLPRSCEGSGNGPSAARRAVVARLRVAALWLLLGVLAAPSFAQISIDNPRGGWRRSQEQGFVQNVYYPASQVNADGTALEAQIRGHIAGKTKDSAGSKPASLIVNGVEMPLLTDASGGFARPYAFGRGSNSIEVRHGKERKRLQFYEANHGMAQTRLRVLLAWDSDSTDLDLHVVTPDGQHCFYGNRVLPDGSALDVDVTAGYGPEIYASAAPKRGAYHVYVNYYGAGEANGIITTARVSIITDEASPREKRQDFRIPLRSPGELNHVKSFIY